MYALCLASEIDIQRANDDFGVAQLQTMQRDKVLAIDGENRAILCGGKVQNFVVGNGLLGISGFKHCKTSCPKRRNSTTTGTDKLSIWKKD